MLLQVKLRRWYFNKTQCVTEIKRTIIGKHLLNRLSRRNVTYEDIFSERRSVSYSSRNKDKVSNEVGVERLFASMCHLVLIDLDITLNL